MLDEFRNEDIEAYFNRMHIAVFADWNYFRPALTQRGTPTVHAASTSPAKGSCIPEVRDTIAKYKKDPKYKPTGYDADHARDMEFTARMIADAQVPPMMLVICDSLSGDKVTEIWYSQFSSPNQLDAFQNPAAHGHGVSSGANGPSGARGAVSSASTQCNVLALLSAHDTWQINCCVVCAKPMINA